MRPQLRLATAMLFLLSTLFLSTATLAAEDEYEDEYDEHARVMRVSLLKGEVSLRRAGDLEWESAQLNVPLVEGDVIASGRQSHFEIQIDARNFVRVGENAVLKVVTLRDEGIALSLSEGGAIVRLARFDPAREYFEIDAPGTTVAAEKRGLYRLDVARDGSVRVTVRNDGRARIYSKDSGFVLRDGKTARLLLDEQSEGEWEFTNAAAFDEWDYWNDERERYLASRLRYEGRERYYDAEVWGAEELDLYGDWAYTREYGYVWRPHVTVINNYHDWAPYRYGQWRWCPPYGWTWIPDEHWGWAPYHYGRWVHYDNRWCWAPRGYGYAYRRAWWRPALVAFVYIPTRYGEHIAWYPLTHGQRDPRGRHWGRRYDRLTPNRSRDVRDSRPSNPANPAFLRAVSSMLTRDFGSGGARAKPAKDDIADRALKSEPVRGRLPVTPADLRRAAAPDGAGRADALPGRVKGEGERPTLSIARPAPVKPPRDLPSRLTGAAPRTPGVSLDGELRRVRVFNNREPRGVTPPVAGTVERGEDGTGAVTRPAPVYKRKPVEGDPNGRGGGDDANAAPRVRPTRPSTAEGGKTDAESKPEPRWRQPGGAGSEDDSPQPRVKPSRPAEERPTTPPAYERPEPRVRRPDPEEAPKTQPRREEAPTYRPARPAPREEPPPARVEPPARQEQPPPPRQEQPPPRQERPAPPPPSRDKEPSERPAPSYNKSKPGKLDQR